MRQIMYALSLYCCTFHFSLCLMNRLNKTGSAIFILHFGLVALEGSTFHQNVFIRYCYHIYLSSSVKKAIYYNNYSLNSGEKSIHREQPNQNKV